MRRMQKNVVLTLVCTAAVVILLLVNCNLTATKINPVERLTSGKYVTNRHASLANIPAAERYEAASVGFPEDGDFEYAQYKTARNYLNRDSTQYINLRSHKMNENSTYHPADLRFDVKVRVVSREGLIALVKVTDKRRRPVPGCSFRTTQYFDDKTSHQMALCATVSYINSTYVIRCSAYGNTCASVEIRYRYGLYEQFQDEPRILPFDYPVYNRKHCNHLDTTSTQLNVPSVASAVSWTVDATTQACETLMLNMRPVRQYTAAETCHCTDRFNDVYLVGTSHIRFFSDFLLKKCNFQNFTRVANNHKDLEAGSVHYLAWVFVEQLHFEIQMNLQKWLDPDLFGLTPPESGNGRTIAIWIQTGSWDFSKISYNFTMEHALPQFAETLSYIQSAVAKSKTYVDLRVISTTPMTDTWYRNNFAISAFNAKVRDIVTERGIDFTDMFAMELPCKDDIEGNHYFYRANETFGGNVGENAYFGHFMPKVCGQDEH